MERVAATGSHLDDLPRSASVCIGAPVARLEAAEFLTALSARVARVELAGEPVPNPNREIRNFSSLPLRFVAA